MALVFSCEFCEIFMKTFRTDNLWTTAFGNQSKHHKSALERAIFAELIMLSENSSIGNKPIFQESTGYKITENTQLFTMFINIKL